MMRALLLLVAVVFSNAGCAVDCPLGGSCGEGFRLDIRAADGGPLPGGSYTVAVEMTPPDLPAFSVVCTLAGSLAQSSCTETGDDLGQVFVGGGSSGAFDIGVALPMPASADEGEKTFHVELLLPDGTSQTRDFSADFALVQPGGPDCEECLEEDGGLRVWKLDFQ